MKTLAPFIALLGNLAATPDRTVSVSEQPAGSNPAEFAILRTETDNLGSYYSDRKKITLEEFTKDKSAEPRTTLLLDISYHIDPQHSDRNTLPEVKETIHHQDATLHWAAILQRYPQHSWTRWTPEQMEKVTVHPIAGIRYNNRVLLLDGSKIHQNVFDGIRPELPWELTEISEDANSLYLRLEKTFEDGVHDSRIVAVPPGITKRVRDQALLKPLYLIAGKFGSEQEALAEARALKTKAAAAKSYQFHPEVWSVWEPTDKIVYVIAEQYSMELIDRDAVQALERLLEVELVPMGSKNFRERTQL
jgi:hypothetical protein